MQPEKIAVFGPMFIFFVIFAAMIFGFVWIVIKLIKKNKASAWTGELIDKIHETRRNSEHDRDDHFYTLVFKTNEGKTVKVGTSFEYFESYHVGDRAEKVAGEFGIKKII